MLKMEHSLPLAFGSESHQFLQESEQGGQSNEQAQFGSRQPPRSLFRVAHAAQANTFQNVGYSENAASQLQMDRSQSVILDRPVVPSQVLEPFVHKAASNCAYHAVHRKGGYRTAMEDTFALVPQFYNLHISHECCSDLLTDRLQAQWKRQSPPTHVDEHTLVSSAPAAYSSSQHNVDQLHYFAVFDGHKGTSAAQFCSTRLHENIRQRLHEIHYKLCKSVSDGSSSQEAQERSLAELKAASKLDKQGSKIDKQDSSEVNELSVGSLDLEATCKECDKFASKAQQEGVCADGNSPSSKSSEKLNKSSSHRIDNKRHTNCNFQVQEAIKCAFLDTQRDFESVSTDNQVGTTAVIALVGERQLYIANVGDSRAVLCRSGTALPLTDDQKPEREDEKQRIQDAKGYVFHFGGAMRVFGKIAMTRAIGDTELQPYILPEPEVTIINRSRHDQFLILASDGLWDVLSNHEACAFVQCIINKTRERDPQITRKQQIKCATRMLVDKALKANSRDNVTAVIVDLDPLYKLT